MDCASRFNLLENIEKLKGRENYLQWSFFMKHALQLAGVWDVIEDTPANHEQDLEAKAAKDRMANAYIGLSLDKELTCHVVNLKTASSVWKKLEDLFSEKGLNTWITLLDRITSLKLEDFNRAQDYVDAFANLSTRLEVLNKPLDDELLAALMLKGLPRRFDEWKLSLELSSVKITSDLVKVKLLHDIDFAQEKFPDSGFVPNKKVRPKCHNCGKFGHVEDRCWRKRNNHPPRRRLDLEEEVLRCLDVLSLQSDDSDFLDDFDPVVLYGVDRPARAEYVLEVPSREPSTAHSTAPSGSNTTGKAESELCRVCFSKPENGLFVHYNTAHVYGCFSCAKKIWRQSGYCPICRRKILKSLFKHQKKKERKILKSKTFSRDQEGRINANDSLSG